MKNPFCEVIMILRIEKKQLKKSGPIFSPVLSILVFRMSVSRRHLPGFG
jgi:hypothetical protein